MVTRQFGMYGWAVLLERGGGETIPFGVFDSIDEAEGWARNRLILHEGETYSIHYVRDVAPPEQEDSLVDFIADAENRFFRTQYDTGANRNALFVWNLVREHAGLPKLTRDDLLRKYAADKGISYEEEVASDKEFEAWRRKQDDEKAIRRVNQLAREQAARDCN